MKILRSIALAFIIVTCLFAGISYAGIGVAPAITETTVSAGTETRGKFVVTNDSDKSAMIRAEIEDWLKRRTGKEGVPVDEWLKVEPMEFEVAAKSSKEVEFIITPPKGYEGEMIAMIFFSAPPSPTGAFNITTRFGVSIYAAVKGTLNIDGSIAGFSAGKSIETKEDGTKVERGIIFYIDVENKSNVHIRPTGEIAIKGEDGSEYKVAVERGFPIYPGEKLSSFVVWEKKDIKPGKYEAVLKLDAGKIYDMGKMLEKKIVFTVKQDGSVAQ